MQSELDKLMLRICNIIIRVQSAVQENTAYKRWIYTTSTKLRC